jgi:hypothetical protein
MKKKIGWSDYMLEAVGDAIQGLVFCFIAMIPLSILGIWKLFEIIAWLLENVSISLS